MLLLYLNAILKSMVMFLIIIFLANCGRKSSDTNNVNIKTTVTSPDGITIAYQQYGSYSPALVFIHGWSCDRSYWEEQSEFFSQKYQVVTIDLPGHGESGLGRKAWTIESYGADVAAVVKELDLQEVILIGHSLGGDIVIAAEPLVREHVTGLVWVDTYRDLGSPNTAEQVQEFIKPFRYNFEEQTYTFVRGMFPSDSKEELADRVAKDMASAPREVAIESLESSFTFGRTITNSLKKVESPIVAINPDNGTTNIASMKRYGIETVLMPDVGHFMMIENPESFNKLLAEAINTSFKQNSE